MTVLEVAARLGVDQLISDDEVIGRVLAGEAELFELIMRRHNQRLYRVVRSILGNDSEVEQVMQDAYVSAYIHLGQFAGRSKFATWLTKIAVHEALALKRRQKRFVDIDSLEEADKGQRNMFASRERTAEQLLLDAEIRSILEYSVEALPEAYRSVLVLRDVEGLDTAETAECLGISAESVKTRLHRARARIRKELYARSGAVLSEAFGFHLSRCDRIVAAVLDRIRQLNLPA